MLVRSPALVCAAVAGCAIATAAWLWPRRTRNATSRPSRTGAGPPAAVPPRRAAAGTGAARRAGRLAPLPVGSCGERAGGWWGVITLVVTEAGLFGYLLFAYFYLQSQSAASWPPEACRRSSRGRQHGRAAVEQRVRVARRARRAGRPAAARVAALAVALALGTAFALVQLHEWRDHPYGPTAHLYGSLYFTITGFHLAHVVAGRDPRAAGRMDGRRFLRPRAAGRADRRRPTGTSSTSCGCSSSPRCTCRRTGSGDRDERRTTRVDPLLAIAAGLVGAPALWFAQMLVSETLASTACYPLGVAQAAPRWARGRVACADRRVRVRIGHCLRDGSRAPRHRHDTDASGATRDDSTRFLARCGMLAALGFVIGLVFTGIITAFVGLAAHGTDPDPEPAPRPAPVRAARCAGRRAGVALGALAALAALAVCARGLQPAGRHRAHRRCDGTRVVGFSPDGGRHRLAIHPDSRIGRGRRRVPCVDGRACEPGSAARATGRRRAPPPRQPPHRPRLPDAATRRPAVKAAAADTDAATLARGRYLAHAGDCAACHDAADHTPYAGGQPVNSPFGPIYAPNITPDPTHGIGHYTLQQFDDALRRGVRADGSRLYPAMPYRRSRG